MNIMKTYQVILTKSYIVTVKAEAKEQAKHFAEFFTGNIEDISAKEERRRLKFSIEEIDCQINENLGAEEIFQE